MNPNGKMISEPVRINMRPLVDNKSQVCTCTKRQTTENNSKTIKTCSCCSVLPVNECHQSLSREIGGIIRESNKAPFSKASFSQLRPLLTFRCLCPELCYFSSASRPTARTTYFEFLLHFEITCFGLNHHYCGH